MQKLFPRLRSEKEAPAGQLSMPKPELQLSNPNKPEITNYKHQIPNKSQISIFNDQNRFEVSNFEFWSL